MSVGRYTLLERAGSGGMGQVWAAYDAELHRKVALKLLNARLRDSESSSDMRGRLVREAQTAAQLNHHNVITIYDVGELGDDVFVAMEFVEGASLRQWLEAAPRTWRETLQVFVAAGRGLAAAHAVGLVHRDFKPDNVLVGDDGRVRVVDFGIARPPGEEGSRVGMKVMESLHVGSTMGRARRDALASPLTQTGSVLGTPAYMAPEQHLEHPVTAACDQFSFCVALYEGLYAQRPYEASSVRELAHRKLAGKVEPPPKEIKIPKWVHRAIERGLIAHPKDRWPSMDALLRVLDRKPVARLRWLAGAAVVATGVIATIVWGAREDPCAGAEDTLAAVWSPERYRAVTAAFEDTDLPYAKDTWARVAESLDSYAQSWVAARIDACEATVVRHEQSDELMDLRMACLNRRLRELNVLLDLFGSADVAIVNHAVEALPTPARLETCAEVAVLIGTAAMPADEEARSRIEIARETVAKARALHTAGKYTDAMNIADVAAVEAEALAYPPLVAEAFVLRARLGKILSRDAEARSDAKRAVVAATAGRDDRLAVEAGLLLAALIGQDHRHEEALTWVHLSGGVIERIGGDDLLEARRLAVHGSIVLDQGQFDEALALFARSLEIRERVQPNQSEVSTVLTDLARVYDKKGEYERALELYRRSLSIQEELHGIDHPATGRALSNMAETQKKLERFSEARDNFERVIRVSEAAVGRDSLLAAYAVGSLGGIALKEGRVDEAIRELRRGHDKQRALLDDDDVRLVPTLSELAVAYVRAGRTHEAADQFRKVLDLDIRAYGDEHPEVAKSVNNLGTVLVDLGRTDEGLRHLERALRLKARVMGPEHPALVTTLGTIASVELDRKRPARALALLQRALVIAELKYGADSGKFASLLPLIGRAHVQRGDPGRAIAFLELAVDKLGPGMDRADAQMALARAVVASGAVDRVRVRELAEHARDFYAGQGDRGADKLAASRTWLHRNRARLE